MRGIAVIRKLSFLPIFFAVIAVAITFTTLLFYGFIREGAALILLILIIPVFYYIGYVNSLVFSITFLMITLTLNLFISKVGIKDLIYYEPNTVLEIFDYQMGQLVYAPKAKFQATLKFGDLKAINPWVDCDLQPREIEFRTDSFGFRNDADYHAQKYLAVGDSFIVGLSNTQKDDLCSQLKSIYNLDVYNLSHPADITGYSRYIRAFEKKYGGNFRALMFVFEGNDFPVRYTRKKEKKKFTSIIGRHLKDAVARYRNPLTLSSLYRLTYIKYLALKHHDNPADKTVVEAIHGHKLAFLKEYVEITRRAAYHPNEDIEAALAAVKDKIACIFFIPEKYRVYHHLERGGDASLPNAQWEFLKRLAGKYHIKCVNLTEPLTQESKKLLAEDKFTWWTDDTHWNRYGIAVAAAQVQKVVSGQ
jgi:hypothetical protein